MLNKILFALFYFLPAGAANTTPVILAKLPFLKKYNYPLDFNKKLGGIRIFGSHKTVRGLIGGVLVAIIFAYLETYLYENSEFVREFSPVIYTEIKPWLLGLLLGFGALAGDFTKSFFKRRMDVAPGKAWIPFDQIDYIIGGIVFSLLYVQVDFVYYILILIIWLILHPISTVLGYLIRLKDEPI